MTEGKKLLAGWYVPEGGKVMHYFKPWQANDYFLIPVCGLLNPQFGPWLKQRTERQCKRCRKSCYA